MFPCCSLIPSAFITVSWANDPAVLIKIKARIERAEEEEGVGKVRVEMEG